MNVLLIALLPTIRLAAYNPAQARRSGLPASERDIPFSSTKEQSVASTPDRSDKDIEIPVDGAPQRQQVQFDDSKAVALYTNFCRVTGTPEELIIDFGLNPQPFGVPTEPIAMTQRIVTNYFTAKRMLHALHMTVQRHEATFGVLETDVQKRVQPAAMRPRHRPARLILAGGRSGVARGGESKAFCLVKVVMFQVWFGTFLCLSGTASVLAQDGVFLGGFF